MDINDFLKKEVQIFDNNVYKPIPKKTITYLEVFKYIGDMNEKHRNIFKSIAAAELLKDNKTKQLLKTKLYYIVPAVIIKKDTHRKYDNIENFTGLMALDFDHLDNAAEFRTFLFNEYDFIAAAWLSASKKGVKALIRIPICKDVAEFKSYYWGLANEIMLQYKGFDTATQNCVLPLFLSPDDDLILGRYTEIWKRKGTNPKDIKPTVKPFKYNIQSNTKYTEWAIKNTKKAIDKIVGNGHPQLRAAAFLLGGYVAAGYLFESDAINLIDSLIVSNLYLSQKSNTYKKTARTMIQKGQLKPVYFT